MAHIHAYGEAAPGARDILHLGATSCYVTDNTDLILMREGLRLLRDRLVGVIDALARFAVRWRDLPTLGFTHFQPAQLTTVGKRACLWCYDFVLDLHEIEHRLATLRFRGAKGTTGTQASFLALFRGDHDKVRRLDRARRPQDGLRRRLPRNRTDLLAQGGCQVLDALSGIGQTAHKYGTDLRLLAHRQEIDEPFEAEQAGSSAMPYKRNPMRCERMCGLARFLSGLAVSAAQTAAVQWLERTLDDSVNRRLTLPQAFLTADAVLRLALNISGGLVVNADVIRAQRGPDAAVHGDGKRDDGGGRGGRRPAGIAPRHPRPQPGGDGAAEGGGGAERPARPAAGRPAAGEVDFDAVLAEGRFVGRAPQQVDEFIAEEVEPIRRRYRGALGQGAEVSV